ncbi:HalOD1 output domain-containing protein [Halomicrobium sp. HM KBTZ05]|uniref:HalOD1 output domain-containing protein n=1 Tax=Halomicrobium sp. HM KBTZ05 TaxID=3242663 RepID=UPI00355798F6
MDSDDSTVYMIRGDTGDEWVSPTPAEDVIVESLLSASELTAAEIGDLGRYVEADELAAVVNGSDEAITFAVEGYDVTVTSDGDVTVE